MLKFGNIGLKEIYNSLQKGDLLRGRVFNAIYIVVSKNIDYYSTRKVKIREIKLKTIIQDEYGVSVRNIYINQRNKQFLTKLT